MEMMMDVFAKFVNEELGVVACPRCGELCRLSSPVHEDARLLKRTDKVEDGLCANCAVASWFRLSPFMEMIDDPQKLLFQPLQEQFAAVMKAGHADMDPLEIDWELVVKHWDLPFPKRKKRGKR